MPYICILDSVAEAFDLSQKTQDTCSDVDQDAIGKSVNNINELKCKVIPTIYTYFQGKKNPCITAIFPQTSAFINYPIIHYLTGIIK